MKIVDSMPDRARFSKKWDEIADLLRQGKVLQFTQGEDFERLEQFRISLISATRTRALLIQTSASDDKKHLTARKREA